MLKQKGIWIITNERKKKVWIGSSGDLDAAIRYKLSAIRSVANENEKLIAKAVYSYPEELKEDILNKELTLVDCRVYKIVINDSMLREFSDNYTTDLKRILKTLNIYSRHVLFKDYELYNGNTDFYLMNRGLIESIDDLELYQQENLITYKTMKEYDYLFGPTKWEDIDLFIKSHKPKVKERTETPVEKEVTAQEPEFLYSIAEEQIDMTRIMKLLEIESVLRNEPVEVLFERFISDKAKQIYDIANR